MKTPDIIRILVILWMAVLPLLGANDPYVANPIPAQNLEAGGSTTTLPLENVFAVTGVSGPLVEFVFGGGRMFIETYPGVAPRTVANFMRYANDKIYDNTIIHRSEPGFVIQAGGYQQVSGLPHVPTYLPISNEFSIPNTAGTMAMAKVDGDLNSATSEWFVNLVDNPSLDTVSQKFTVFAKVIGNGLQFCQSIAALQRVDLYPGDPSNPNDPYNNDPFNTVPVVNYNGGTVFLSNLLALKSVRPVPILQKDSTTSGYLVPSATSSNSAAISVEITDSGLKLNSGVAGDATITVTAVDLYGQTVSTSFGARSIAPPILTSAIALRPNRPAYGTVRGAGMFPTGMRVTVKAVPKPGRRFKKWTEAGRTVSLRASYSFTAITGRSLVATFTAN